ncbi:MAG: hypothetical protein QM655_01790 [Nocardioidaceae bacterium]
MLLVGAPLLAAAILTTVVSPSDEETAPVTVATREAMSAMQQITGMAALSIDPDVNETATHETGTFSKSDEPELFRLDKDRIAAAQDVGRQRLEAYFTGKQLDWFLSFNNSMQEEYAGLTVPEGAPGSPEADETVTNNYGLTGGADHFEDVDVALDGDQATVTGSARIWSNGASVRDGATKVDNIDGIVNFKAHLVRSGSEWKVDDYSDEFAPGSEP